jgi:ligand-binding sensor domain-containing protein
VTNSGLADDWVLAIAVDESGAVWFGTHGGVCKFDGITWTTYDTLSSGLAANEIWATAIDRAGAKWFGTRRGVS